MEATHSLHSKSGGNVVYLLHDSGAGQVYYRTPDSGAWRVAWYPAAATASIAFDVRKINKFKGNR